MEYRLTLDRLAVGQRASVCEVGSTGAMRRRMFDLGVAQGTVIECVGKSPSGDPSAYLIKGAVIALRESDAKEISVKLLEGGK